MEQDIILSEELRKLGLARNEARVYLLLLGLGHASIQDIAKQASLSRPTIYRILENLQKRGLTEKLGKKNAAKIKACSPDELLGILRAQKRKVEEQEREFLRIISLLQTKYFLADENKIEIYSGKKGKDFVKNSLANTTSEEIFMISNSLTGAEIEEMEGIYGTIRKRLGKNFSVREIHATNMENSDLDFLERKASAKLKEHFSKNILVSDKILFFDKKEVFLIEQPAIVEMFRSMMSLIWNCIG